MVSFLVIGLEFLGDTEGVHGVVVDVDEGFVAVVHGGDEVRQLFEVVVALVMPDIACVVHHVGGDTGHK